MKVIQTRITKEEREKTDEGSSLETKEVSKVFNLGIKMLSVN